MTKETQTVETVYGTATIETYECDSCSNVVPYEETVEFRIGEREGRACVHCEAEGPVSWPRKVLEFRIPGLPFEDDDGELANLESVGIFIAMAPLLMPIGVLRSFTVDTGEFAKGVAYATIAMLFWGFVIVATNVGVHA